MGWVVRYFLKKQRFEICSENFPGLTKKTKNLKSNFGFFHKHHLHKIPSNLSVGGDYLLDKKTKHKRQHIWIIKKKI